MQTAEGALNEVSSILIRLRELAIQSSNGSVSNQDKETLDQEFQNLVTEVDRIGRSTEFSGIKLLDGSATSVTFQVGLGTTSGIDQLDVTLSPALSTSLSLNSLDIGSGGATSTAITSIDTAINSVSSLRGTLGAVQNRLATTINNLAIATENLTSAESRIRDVDVAYETAQLTRNNLLQQASISVLSQANSQPQSALQLLQS
jgi:flagellin